MALLDSRNYGKYRRPWLQAGWFFLCTYISRGKNWFVAFPDSSCSQPLSISRICQELLHASPFALPLSRNTPSHHSDEYSIPHDLAGMPPSHTITFLVTLLQFSCALQEQSRFPYSTYPLLPCNTISRVNVSSTTFPPLPFSLPAHQSQLSAPQCSRNILVGCFFFFSVGGLGCWGAVGQSQLTVSELEQPQPLGLRWSSHCSHSSN